MLKMLTTLCPISYQKNERIYNELDDVSIVVFVMDGACKVGFEVNKREHYYLQQGKSTTIGLFECSYNKRSIFVYKTKSEGV